ncbi:hypothetical protein CTI14_53450, partial [Methylobacterium radiotolerans]
DVYGTMHVNGTQLWRRGTEDPYELNKGTTVYLYPEDSRYIYNRGTTPFTLDADMTTDQYAKFEASFTDFDKWPNGDDVLGSVNETCTAPCTSTARSSGGAAPRTPTS